MLTVTPWYTVSAPVWSSLTVTQPDAASAVPAGENPIAAASAPTKASADTRPRRGVRRAWSGIDGAPEEFFTTTGLIGTLHVDLEPCNLEGVPVHEIGTIRV